MPPAKREIFFPGGDRPHQHTLVLPFRRLHRTPSTVVVVDDSGSAPPRFLLLKNISRRRAACRNPSAGSAGSADSHTVSLRVAAGGDSRRCSPCALHLRLYPCWLCVEVKNRVNAPSLTLCSPQPVSPIGTSYFDFVATALITFCKRLISQIASFTSKFPSPYKADRCLANASRFSPEAICWRQRALHSASVRLILHKIHPEVPLSLYITCVVVVL